MQLNQSRTGLAFTTISSVDINTQQFERPIGGYRYTITPTPDSEWIVTITPTVGEAETFTSEDIVDLAKQLRDSSAVQIAIPKETYIDVVLFEGRLDSVSIDNGIVTETTQGVYVKSSTEAVLCIDLEEDYISGSLGNLVLKLQPHYSDSVVVTFSGGVESSVSVDLPNISVVITDGESVEDVMDQINSSEAAYYIDADFYGNGSTECTTGSVTLHTTSKSGSGSIGELLFTVTPAFDSEEITVEIDTNTTASVTTNFTTKTVTIIQEAGFTAQDIYDLVTADSTAMLLIDVELTDDGTSTISDDSVTLSPDTSPEYPSVYGFTIYGFTKGTWYLRSSTDLGGVTFLNKSFYSAIPVKDFERLWVFTRVTTGLGTATTKVGVYSGH